MIHLILAAFLAFLVPLYGAQTPKWEWTHVDASPGEDIARALVVDASNDIYVAGSFQSPSLTIGTTTMVDTGLPGSSIYLAKYDSSGRVLWARNIHGSGTARAIATDTSGHVYVAGNFEKTVEFDAITLSAEASKGYHVFVAKFDSNGKVVWARGGTGGGHAYGYKVSCSPSGDVYLAGSFAAETLTFGAITLTGSGKSDAFIFKFDTNGNPGWGHAVGGAGPEAAWSVGNDASGNAYLVGGFSSPIITLGAARLVNADDSGKTADMFIAKYDRTGRLVWAKRAGGILDDHAINSTTDASGHTYVTGYFTSPSASFDSIAVKTAGGFDIFLAKYDANGSAMWAKRFGGSASDLGLTVVVDRFGNCYLGGEFGGFLHMGGDLSNPGVAFGSTVLTSHGVGDLYVAKLDAAGNVLWATSAGGTTDDMLLSLGTDAAGNVYASGGFSSPTITIGANTYKNLGSYDAWVGRIGNAVIPKKK